MRIDVIPRVSFSWKMSKIRVFSDGLRISHRKAPSALDFARSYAFSTHLRGWTEWTGRFREIGWTLVKRSGPFSRFVYFYAKPRGISLLLCSPERECICSSQLRYRFPRIFLFPFFFLSLSLFVHRYTLDEVCMCARDAFPVSSWLVRFRWDLRGTKGELPFSRQRE